MLNGSIIKKNIEFSSEKIYPQILRIESHFNYGTEGTNMSTLYKFYLHKYKHNTDNIILIRREKGRETC